jgi:hypothetical protein
MSFSLLYLRMKFKYAKSANGKSLNCVVIVWRFISWQ